MLYDCSTFFLARNGKNPKPKFSPGRFNQLLAYEDNLLSSISTLFVPVLAQKSQGWNRGTVEPQV